MKPVEEEEEEEEEVEEAGTAGTLAEARLLARHRKRVDTRDI